MPTKTIVTGLVLVLIALVGYFGSDARATTAWIPAFFGVPLILLGVFARKPSLVKLLMHIAVVLGLLGAVGAAVRVIPVLGDLFGGTLERPLATYCQLAMAVVCVVFVVQCVRSFIEARRARG